MGDTFCWVLSPGSKRPDGPCLSLDGGWKFMVDRHADLAGPAEEHHTRDKEFTGRIRVPGCWQRQVGEQAASAFADSSMSTVFFQKRVALPDAWQGGRVWLRLRDVAPVAEAWLNGGSVGFT